MSLTTMNSSAWVRSCKACRPARTVSGLPTTAQPKKSFTAARSWGCRLSIKPATGGASLPRRPVTMPRMRCCTLLARNSASASEGAATTGTATMAWGLAKLALGRKVLR